MNQCTPEETIQLRDALQKAQSARLSRDPAISRALSAISASNPPAKLHETPAMFVVLINQPDEDWLIAIDRHYSELGGWLTLATEA